MSEFKCEVVRVKIEPHPNADAIEIARVGDYQSIVRKGQVKDGDLAVYIPEQAVVPEWLLREMGMYDDERKKGGLAGAAGNRVKAIKLRGVLSQGLILPVHFEDQDGDPYHFVEGEGALNVEAAERLAPIWRTVEEGDDVAEFLGIVKYEPVASHFGGPNVSREPGAYLDKTHKYDFDNLKKMPTMFEDGEEVVITEKIHGTLIQVGVVPSSQADEKFYKGRVVISSKGLGARGYIVPHDDESNIYAQAAARHGLLDKALAILGEITDDNEMPGFILGEVFGKTPSGADIQDLTYTDEPVDFRAFDICVGNRGREQYYPWLSFSAVCEAHDIPTVPLLHHGAYSKEVVLALTDGNTTLTDKKQIREGVVVKSAQENRSRHFGRKIAKSISEAYLLRKNATEFN